MTGIYGLHELTVNISSLEMKKRLFYLPLKLPSKTTFSSAQNSCNSWGTARLNLKKVVAVMGGSVDFGLNLGEQMKVNIEYNQ